ncbi:acetate and sugar kinases/Hsc70/actin family protein [Spirochaeta lutea]|uniref:Xylulose kinase n=1 Tax=Spirochaeta lutea TaxID=1480694 RepID=A0A098R005_9SPIO|nr:hypothetical protein [Spirochaeta lutea]KGE72062.1 hypothetical protein DC28_08120 [Spirochaeta lutea]
MTNRNPSAGDTLVLGLDISTQSITGTLLSVNPRSYRVLADHSLAYARDERTKHLGIDPHSLIIPGQEPGQAEQPAVLFLAALDALLEDLKGQGAALSEVAAIQISAQQHGHAYLNDRAPALFAALNSTVSGGAGSGKSAGPGDGSAGPGGEQQNPSDPDLKTRLEPAFSYPGCPIWMTSNTSREADDLRRRSGGKDAVIALSGSDSPLRFTGAVIRRIALTDPGVYGATASIRLLNSLMAGVLSGNPDVPADWGNASGMTLMDYKNRTWSSELLEAAAGDLPGGARGLEDRLGGLAHPLTWAGRVASYFTQRYGFSPDCLVGVGSGDNPQSKVGTWGDLLSLGTSFVYMIHQDEPQTDPRGFANSMYDGLGQPFVFACRTNGALVWDQVRRSCGIEPQDFAAADQALAASAPGEDPLLFQPLEESFPPSPVTGRIQGDLVRDYPGVVDSSLGLLWYYSRHLSAATGPLAITGGPSASPEICRRVASLWQRPVVRVAGSGASLGAALAAYAGLILNPEGRGDFNAGSSVEAAAVLAPLVSRGGAEIPPDPVLVAAYHHGSDAYIPALIRRFEALGS